MTIAEFLETANAVQEWAATFEPNMLATTSAVFFAAEQHQKAIEAMTGP